MAREGRGELETVVGMRAQGVQENIIHCNHISNIEKGYR